MNTNKIFIKETIKIGYKINKRVQTKHGYYFKNVSSKFKDARIFVEQPWIPYIKFKDKNCIHKLKLTRNTLGTYFTFKNEKYYVEEFAE